MEKNSHDADAGVVYGLDAGDVIDLLRYLPLKESRISGALMPA